MTRPSIPPRPKAPERRNKVQDFVSTSRGEIMVVIHTSDPPNDAEWREYIDGVLSTDLHSLRSVVITDGGAPNSAQRKALNEALNGAEVPGIVVTPSALVRGVVTALSWFNKKIKAYAPEDFDRACTYLELSGPEIEVVWETIDRLRALLDNPDLRAIPVRKNK